jgi:hypothetical protein
MPAAIIIYTSSRYGNVSVAAAFQVLVLTKGTAA